MHTFWVVTFSAAIYQPVVGGAVRSSSKLTLSRECAAQQALEVPVDAAVVAVDDGGVAHNLAGRAFVQPQRPSSVGDNLAVLDEVVLAVQLQQRVGAEYARRRIGHVLEPAAHERVASEGSDDP